MSHFLTSPAVPAAAAVDAVAAAEEDCPAAARRDHAARSSEAPPRRCCPKPPAPAPAAAVDCYAPRESLRGTAHLTPSRLAQLSNALAPEEKRSFCWSFPYVCPEPVLVKCSFLYINGSKRPFLLTCRIDPAGAVPPPVPVPAPVPAPAPADPAARMDRAGPVGCSRSGASRCRGRLSPKRSTGKTGLCRDLAHRSSSALSAPSVTLIPYAAH
jgi:hypothetical protein